MRCPLLLMIGCLIVVPAAGAICGALAAKLPPAQGRIPPHPDSDEYEEGQGGILYGQGWAFLIEAPKGWIMDDQGNGGQVNVAFYRRGESFAEGAATMYGQVLRKVKGEDDTLDKVIRFDIQQSKKHDPGLKPQRGEALETADGRKAVVYNFAGRGRGRADETVAYIDTPRFVIMLALTAVSEKAYKAALPDFTRLVHSFGFLNKTESNPQRKQRPAKRGKKGG